MLKKGDQKSKPYIILITIFIISVIIAACCYHIYISEKRKYHDTYNSEIFYIDINESRYNQLFQEFQNNFSSRDLHDAGHLLHFELYHNELDENSNKNYSIDIWVFYNEEEQKLTIELNLPGSIGTQNDLKADTNNFIEYFSPILGEPIDIDYTILTSTSLNAVISDAMRISANIILIINLISCSIFLIYEYWWKRKQK